MMSAYYPSIKGIGRSLRATWRAGGVWERFFDAWPFVGFALFVSIFGWFALVLRTPPDQMQFVGLVVVGVGITFLPAGWASENVATLRALMEAGLESPELTRMKIEYLERFGAGGGNPTARRWALSYIAGYSTWSLVALSGPGQFGVSLLVFAFVDVALVVGLGVVFGWKVHSYNMVAESRGYPIEKVAIRLRKQRVRW